MSAIEMACFPVLEELRLSTNAKLTDGFDYLFQAIRAGHLSNLRKLVMGATLLKSSKEAAALATAILMHCPKMTMLSLPAILGPSMKLAIRGILQGKENLQLAFW
jgi:hypothetical protein